MRISKSNPANKPIQSSETTKPDSRVIASQHIKSAIDVLGATAKSDPVARESIANLSVVLLDLQ